MNRPLAVLFFFFLTLFNYSIAQELEESESCAEPDKSVMKLIKTAETTKNDMMTRTKAYTDAVEAAPENAYVHYGARRKMYRQLSNRGGLILIS